MILIKDLSRMSDLFTETSSAQTVMLMFTSPEFKHSETNLYNLLNKILNTNKMKNTIIISLAFILILIGSCRKKLDIDIPEANKHIVVNGLITKDSLIKINVSKSQNALENGNIPIITNATVKLFEDNSFLENLTYTDSGFYYSSITPQLEKNYKITVDYDNLQSVSAKMKLLPAVPIVSIDTTIEVDQNNFMGDDEGNIYYLGKKINLKIKFNDTANESNFYFISISMLTPTYSYEGETPVYIGLREEIKYFNSDNLIFNNADYSFFINKMYGQVFSDEIFNGLQYTLNGSVYTSFEKYENIEITDTPKIIVRLLTVNEDIYRYISSYNLNQETEYDPFAQPVQIFTNVENGLGLFSGYTMAADTLDFEIN